MHRGHHGQTAAVRQGITRPDGEVEHDLFEVCRADIDPFDVMIERQRDDNVRSEHLFGRFCGVGDRGVDVNHSGGAAPRAESAQRSRQSRCTQRGTSNLLSVLHPDR